MPYFRHNVIPVGGAEEKLPVTEKINPASLTVFDTPAANTVLLDADMQIKSGYPTIATSSMVSRRRRSETFDELEFSPDVRFFSELVKPIQYRWKFQHDKNKIILPSKHGYHPRSKSPTFQRLVEATEKLQIIMEHDSGMGSFEKDDEFETRSQLTPDGPVLSMEPTEREIKSEPASVKPSVYSMPPVKPIELHSYTRPIPKYTLETETCQRKNSPELQQNEEIIELDNETDTEFENVLETPTQVKSTLLQQPEFKVDFKKMDTHSELHLFLPLINDGQTANESHAKQNSHRRVHKVRLPSIDDSVHSKSEEKFTSRKERKPSEHRKRRKRNPPRINSGHDENEVKDILNDVPTLMSMKQGDLVAYHTASMCMFENCEYHPRHNKSTKIRQA